MINGPVTSDKPVMCHEPPEYDNAPELPDTGVRRETPIDVVPKELFIERLEASPLWGKASYSNHFERDFLLSGINGFLQIQGDGSFSKSESITNIAYFPLDIDERNKYGHQILDQENFAMTEIINLVIDNHDKASAILDQLYQQYMAKVRSNKMLSDNETIHTYIRHDGILFELWGANRTKYDIAECNLKMLMTLTIN